MINVYLQFLGTIIPSSDLDDLEKRQTKFYN